MTRVAFLLTPQLHLLDLAGPAQVFSSASELGHPYEISYLAEQEDVHTAQGLPVKAQVVWPDLRPEDLVVVPGWRSPASAADPTSAAHSASAAHSISAAHLTSAAHPATPGHRGRAGRSGRPGTEGSSLSTGRAPSGWLRRASLDWLFEHHAAGGTVASVCSAAAALGQAGLLDGRRCTTHHQLQDDLARDFPQATVVRDVLYVVDDRVATSAGIASGIDLALHLVAVRHGPAVAAQVAREMVVYSRRNGHEPQVSAMLRYRAHLSDTVHRVQDLIDSRYAEALPLGRLAGTAGVSERTLTRLFESSTGNTPLRYQQVLRVEQAEHLIGQGLSVEAAARTVGFADARMLRRLRARA